MKRFMAIILIGALALTSVMAAPKSNDDIDLTFNAGANNFNFSLKDSKDTNAQFKFDASVEARFNMHFKGAHGFYAGLSFTTEQGNMLGLGAGYAYKTYLGNNFDLVFGAGLDMGFKFGGATEFILGAALDLDFNYNVYKNLYLQFGIDWDMDFLSVRSVGDTTVSKGFFDSSFIIPSLGFGYSF